MRHRVLLSAVLVLLCYPLHTSAFASSLKSGGALDANNTDSGYDLVSSVRIGEPHGFPLDSFLSDVVVSPGDKARQEITQKQHAATIEFPLGGSTSKEIALFLIRLLRDGLGKTNAAAHSLGRTMRSR